jgi:hypothetical protein
MRFQEDSQQAYQLNTEAMAQFFIDSREHTIEDNLLFGMQFYFAVSEEHL